MDIDRLVSFVQQVRYTARENGDETTAQLPAAELLAKFSSRFNAMGGAGAGHIGEAGSAAASAVQGLRAVGDSSTDAGAVVSPTSMMVNLVKLAQQATTGEGVEPNLFGVNGGGGGGGHGGGGGGGASETLADMFLNAHNSREGGGEGEITVDPSGGTESGGSGSDHDLDVGASASQVPDLLHTTGQGGDDAAAPEGASFGGGGGLGGMVIRTRRAGLDGLLNAAQMVTESEGEGSRGVGIVGGSKVAVGIGGVGGVDGGGNGGSGGSGCSGGNGGSDGGGVGGDAGGGDGNDDGNGDSSTRPGKGKSKLVFPEEGFDEDGNDVSKIESEASTTDYLLSPFYRGIWMCVTANCTLGCNSVLFLDLHPQRTCEIPRSGS